MRKSPARIALLALISAALLGATACEKDPTAQPSETCTKVADQCKLPGGPLGVCNMVTCKPGETPPCLRCVSQH